MTRGARRLVGVDGLLAPYVLVPVLGGSLLMLYLLVPDAVFEREFSSRKWDAPLPAAFYVLALVAFALGAAAGDVMARRPTDGSAAGPGDADRALVYRVCVVALAISAAAYALWWAIGIGNAGGIAKLLRTFADDPETVRTEYLTTIPGLTTLTQTAVAAIPLALAFRVFDRRWLVALAALVFVFASARAILDSERLALLELALPALYLVVAGRRFRPARLAIGGAIAAAAVVAFFVLNELRRRGAYGEFALDDALWRLGGYYVATINNAFAVVDHHRFETPLYFTAQAVWEFPGMRRLGITPENVTGVDATQFFETDFFRLNVVSPSVNTFGVVGSVAADFGWAALLWLLGLGAAAGAIYRAAVRNPLYRALYALWFVGMLEFVRIYYFVATRVVPAYAVFVVAAVLLDPRARRLLPRAPSQVRGRGRARAPVGQASR